MLNKPITGWKIPPVEAMNVLKAEMEATAPWKPEKIRMNPQWAAANFPWATTRIEGVQGYKSLMGIPLEWDDTIATYKIDY